MALIKSDFLIEANENGWNEVVPSLEKSRSLLFFSFMVEETTIFNLLLCR